MILRCIKTFLFIIIKSMNPCIFCGIYQDRVVIYRDEMVTVFDSNHHDAKTHILIIPNRHIKNLYDLNRTNAFLLRHMRNLASTIVMNNIVGNETVCIGFHKPPFISVPHLHLHVVIQPSVTSFIKYMDYTPWFISLDRFMASFRWTR